MIAYLAAWVFVFAVPWQNVIVLPGLGTISKVLGIAALAITVLAVLVRGEVRPLHPIHFAVLLFVTWVGISAYWAINDPEHTLTCVVTYLQLAVMLWMVWEVAPTRGRLLGLMQAYILGGYVSAIDTITNYRVDPEGEYYQRFAATGFDPNELGSILALGIPIAWYLQATTTSRFVRWMARGYLPLAVAAIGLTASRGAMVGTIIALTIVPLTLTRLRWGVRIMAIFVVLGMAVFAVRFIPRGAWDRLSTTREEVSSGTLNHREVIWRAGLQVYPERPVHGFGPAGFQIAVIPVLGEGAAPHNAFLAVLVEEGIIGFLLYMSLFVILFRAILRLPTLERRYALVLFFTLVVSLLPLGWQTAKPAWLIIAFLIGSIDHFAYVPAPLMPAAPPVPIPVPAIRRS